MLLPIAGLPLIALCAKRAMRQSPYDFTVATSSEKSDDDLIPVLQHEKIAYCRGSLEDVLSRFVIAAEGMRDDDLVVRLTGDNPVVDSDFINLILMEHKNSGSRYTRSLSPFDRLPYGVSAEVIEVGLLRSLNERSSNAYEREHVTIHYTNAGQYHLFNSPLVQDMSHLRMTVDTQDDYDRMAELFYGEDAITVPWHVLVSKLAHNTNAFRTPYKRTGLRAQSIFALGTVQLGLPYGIANASGQPSVSEASQILKTAIEHGVTWIDTAAAYGVSEKVIGLSLSATQKHSAVIVTKLTPDAVTKDDALASIEKSLNSLGLTHLPYLLLHRWVQRYSLVWDVLKELQGRNIIGSLGVSVQSPEEGLSALLDDSIRFIQIPYNICDRRWEKFSTARRKRRDVHIQARSALLQGVLILSPEKWPLEYNIAQTAVAVLSQLVAERGRKSIADLCYAYVRSQDWIDSVVVGVETKQQLLDNLNLFNEPPLERPDEAQARLPYFEEQFLNPSLWPKR